MFAMLPSIAAIVAAPTLLLLAMHWKSYRPQHAGGGDGALTVWQLIAEAEAERQQRQRGGRHRLRDPEGFRQSTSDTNGSGPPPPEIQRRILEALHRL
ncbi:hypothetical protein AB0I53_23125 [Saccharopolyspora sp. NPDC050389]|uniref:hypothetical protein n=1 Tax=Saccharopolyspora sp. NPDC050389 TaxID=3155516 RepID=UPI003403DAC4